jgi:hypothetical protein
MVVLAALRNQLVLPAGDEPHYLIMSQALERYHSLDLQRVYDAGDYTEFYPRPIWPHTSPGPNGEPLPWHGIGGPVLWLVPFALGGRAGVIAFMVVISLLIVANVFLLARALGVSTRTAFGVGLAFAVGTPILTYSSMSFVEPIGALVCVYALRLLHTNTLRTATCYLSPPAWACCRGCTLDSCSSRRYSSRSCCGGCAATVRPAATSSPQSRLWR